MRNIIEQILDEENTSFLKIISESGEIALFEQVAVLPMDLDTFALLHPLEKGVHPDEVMVFRILVTKDEAALILEENPDIINECFEEYYRLIKTKKIIK